ncbi:hypothetical protein ACEYYB_00020 [Paracoccus sp. p4-l81]|uniref:hypothetical protein n=1 Tax=unclassified Paracoccus (in: a-proteobacteria) TaxID=2688777 RepID=UPI0035BB3565
MNRLFFLILTLSAPTLAGIGLVVALTMNRFDTMSVIVAVAIGALLGIPAAWIVARKIEENDIDLDDGR